MNEIARHFSPGMVVTANSSAATTSGMFPFGRFGGACVMIANTNGATQINWFATVDPAVTPQRVYADGSALSTAVTVGVHPVPDACYAANFVVPVIISSASTCAMTVMAKG
jgi:hypothetical protein